MATFSGNFMYMKYLPIDQSFSEIPTKDTPNVVGFPVSTSISLRGNMMMQWADTN